MVFWFVAILGSYLIGAIPIGYIICKSKTGEDIREVGSKATGATNIARRLGIGWAVFVGLLDLTKGLGSCLLIMKLIPGSGATMIVVGGLAAIIGHIYPVWIGFRGGKGINTALGVALVISPWAVLIAVIAFLSTFVVSRIVSVSSLSAVLVYFVTVVFFEGHIGVDAIAIKVFAGLLLIIVIWSHRSNLKRLIKGEELSPKKIEK